MTHLFFKLKKVLPAKCVPTSSSGPAEHVPSQDAEELPSSRFLTCCPFLVTGSPAKRLPYLFLTQRSCPLVLSKYLNIGFVLEMLFVGEDEYSYYVQCAVLLNVLHVTPFGPHCSPVRGRHVVLVF